MRYGASKVAEDYCSNSDPMFHFCARVLVNSARLPAFNHESEVTSAAPARQQRSPYLTGRMANLFAVRVSMSIIRHTKVAHSYENRLPPASRSS